MSGWVTQAVSGVKLSRVGTQNVGVSAAFYHGGKLAGILSVLVEAAKGIAVVFLARQFFPADPVWEIIALIGLVMGRYWFARGAGTTNVVWGVVVYAPVTALLCAVGKQVPVTVCTHSCDLSQQYSSKLLMANAQPRLLELDNELLLQHIFPGAGSLHHVANVCKRLCKLVSAD